MKEVSPCLYYGFISNYKYKNYKFGFGGLGDNGDIICACFMTNTNIQDFNECIKQIKILEKKEHKLKQQFDEFAKSVGKNPTWILGLSGEMEFEFKGKYKDNDDSDSDEYSDEYSDDEEDGYEMYEGVLHDGLFISFDPLKYSDEYLALKDYNYMDHI